MIRYAGYDPDENNFEGIPLAPLHHAFEQQSTGNRGGGKRSEIDVERALSLKESGFSWRDIGIILAKEKGRIMPFHRQSIKVAMIRNRKLCEKIDEMQT